MTLRFTSPHAARVSINVRLMAAMAGLRRPLMMPWNWMACRVVTRSVPFAWLSAMESIARYCAGVATPPGTRTRTMKLKAGSSPAFFRSARMSRSSCW